MAALLVKQLREAVIICWISIAISDKLAVFILVVDSQELRRNKWLNFLRKLIKSLSTEMLGLIFQRPKIFKETMKYWKEIPVSLCCYLFCLQPTHLCQHAWLQRPGPQAKLQYYLLQCIYFFILAIILHSIFSHMLPVQVFVNNFSTVI